MKKIKQIDFLKESRLNTKFINSNIDDYVLIFDNVKTKENFYDRYMEIVIKEIDFEVPEYYLKLDFNRKIKL